MPIEDERLGCKLTRIPDMEYKTQLTPGKKLGSILITGDLVLIA
jgi:hypothetical protein